MPQNENLQLQPHPEILALRFECERFAQTLTDLIVRRDSLRRNVLPAIAARYNLKIGHLEYQVFWTDCELRALKRRIELAQAALNRGAKPCYQTIETQITAEFLRWREQTAEKRREIEASQRFADAPKMSAADSKQFQTLYRNLAKRLHPDLNRATEQNQKLWRQTCEAYAEGDLTALETLWLIIENNRETKPGDDSHTLAAQRAKREKLLLAIIKINDEIAAICRETPYIWQKILNDEREINRRREELQQTLKNLREQRRQLTAHWAAVMQTAKDREFVPNAPSALTEIDAEIKPSEF